MSFMRTATGKPDGVNRRYLVARQALLIKLEVHRVAKLSILQFYDWCRRIEAAPTLGDPGGFRRTSPAASGEPDAGRRIWASWRTSRGKSGCGRWSSGAGTRTFFCGGAEGHLPPCPAGAASGMKKTRLPTGTAKSVPLRASQPGYTERHDQPEPDYPGSRRHGRTAVHPRPARDGRHDRGAPGRGPRRSRGAGGISVLGRRRHPAGSDLRRVACGGAGSRSRFTLKPRWVEALRSSGAPRLDAPVELA